jgi:branched-chain amino acid transport system substrate-binding protein
VKPKTLRVYGFLIPLFLAACLVSAEREAIVVGSPLPLNFTYGQNGLRSLTLAAEEINAKGGILLQGKRYPVKLEIIDTNDLDPKATENETMAKIESLITDKKAEVLVGGPSRSEYGLATMDVIAGHNVVHIVSAGCYSPQWSEDKYSSNPEKYRKSFRISGNVAWYIQEARDLLAFLQKNYGFKKMFILNQDSLMCRDAAAIIKQYVTKEGWTIVGHESSPPETKDFAPYLKKCKESGGQLLFLWFYSPNTSYLFEQWMNMEIPALPLGFVSAAEDPDFWKKTKGKCAYSVITLSEAGVTPSDVTPRAKPYYAAYKKRWGEPPRSTASVANYEALYVLKYAIEKAGSLRPEKLIPVLETINLPVVRGRLRFDKNHQCILGYDPQNAILGNWAQWQNGKRVTIWPPAAKMGDLKIPPFLQWFWLQKKKFLNPSLK